MKVLDALNESYDRYYRGDRRVLAKTAGVGGALAQHFQLQEALRPLFGKGHPVEPSIGDHPDFEHLKLTRAQEFAPITTLFLDMEGSTRLGLIFEPLEVFRIKNGVIQATIDIIKAFDGHVHRIMGDAVMAYFGSKACSVECGAIDAINCAASIRALIGKLIEQRFPQLKDETFGIRIGVDHGPKDRVLWAAYGYPGMEEVTATSFYVDVAAKLQHSAGRNQIMVGQSLRELLDLPDEVLSLKTTTSGGEQKTEPYVLPNYSKVDGGPVNYRKFLFRWDTYLRCSKLAAAAPSLLGESNPMCRYDVKRAREQRDDAITGSYLPCSEMVAKGTELRFSFELTYQPRLPYSVTFRVENHGREASSAPENGNHTSEPVQRSKPGNLNFVHWESTRYRGFHYLDLVLNSPAGRETARLGVWVE